MNPQCAACKKTVYPMEKLNCLDKIWHKGCFRCSTCGMTLNMKNYKGYNKLPYCAAHYPSTRFTSVADTPENKRLAQNTANQSSLTYHAEYEKQKGTKLEVADDMETIRASKSAQIASEVSYRGVRSQREHQEAHRPDQVIEDARRTPRHQAVGRISDYDPAESNPSPYSARSQMPTIYDSNKGGRVGEAVSGNRKVGKISEYDPELNQFGNPGRVEPVNQYNPPPTSAPGRDPQQPWPSRQVPQQYRNSAGPPQQPPVPVGAPPNLAKSNTPRYRAVYDYVAADEDEISFSDGDMIIDVTIIDDGWMEGRNQRTGKYGMLPSNYVEKA